MNRTFYYWHIFAFDLRPGQIYPYRADGPYAPERGHRTDRNKVLFDPHAREIAQGENWSRDQAKGLGDNCANAMRCVVIGCSGYSWEGDGPLRNAFNETVVHETHVGGFTKHPSSRASYPGTYYGVIEKTAYLISLGSTAVE